MSSDAGWQTLWRARFGAVLREPLVHFLLIGAALFMVMGGRGDPVDPASRTIKVTAADAERLALRFAQTWQRQPTAGEIDALIREDIKDEVYAREAMRLGLGEGDPIIRRRLRSKMEYLARAEVDAVVPTDATLTAWIAKNPARYAAGGTTSFEQIYFVATDMNRARAAAADTQAQLAAGADWLSLGDKISLTRSMSAADDGDIDRTFGDGFAAGLAKAPVGQWTGPLTSGYGLHLVRVTRRGAGAPPRLADVRQRVENDWRAATAADREARAYQALLDGYTIQIDKP